MFRILDDFEDELIVKDKKIKRLGTEITRLRFREEKFKREIETFEKKYNDLLRVVENLTDSVRSLGSIPVDLFDTQPVEETSDSE